MVSSRKQRDHQYQILELAAEADLMDQNSNHAKRRYINRNHLMGHRRIIKDYFCVEPVYPLDVFQRRFRMERHVFLRIHDVVTAYDLYFQQKSNAANMPGLSSIQKITVAMRMLAYGKSSDIFYEYIRIGETTSNESLKIFCRAVVEIFGSEYLRAMRMLAYGESSDIFDEYIRIGETTSNESLKIFCRAVVEIFGSEYLRKPNVDDIERLLAIGEERGFPGMLGSIDCMH